MTSPTFLHPDAMGDPGLEPFEELGVDEVQEPALPGDELRRRRDVGLLLKPLHPAGPGGPEPLPGGLLEDADRQLGRDRQVEPKQLDQSWDRTPIAAPLERGVRAELPLHRLVREQIEEEGSGRGSWLGRRRSSQRERQCEKQEDHHRNLRDADPWRGSQYPTRACRSCHREVKCSLRG
jgi:hypothetical protein